MMTVIAGAAWCLLLRPDLCLWRRLLWRRLLNLRCGNRKPRLDNVRRMLLVPFLAQRPPEGLC
jgi:hypothetical protein